MENLEPTGFEHLKEGINPIRVCAGDKKAFSYNPGPPLPLSKRVWKEEKHPDVLQVNFYAPQNHLREKQMSNDGSKTYVISPVDTRDKFSKEFCNCGGLLVAGRDKQTGAELSFLTHHNPEYFLHSKYKERAFIFDIKTKLEEMKERCEPGTLDAVLFGGRDSDDYAFGDIDEQEEYELSITLVKKEVLSVLGFEPAIPTEPKIYGEEHAYYDTINRRLYLLQPKTLKE